MNCKETTRSGEPCRRTAGESGYCPQHDPDGAFRCQAKSRKHGGRCSAPAVRGSKFCKFHFGKTNRDTAVALNHAIKHGRYSKALARRFDKFSELLKDPQLLRLAEEIAVARTQIATLLDDEERIHIDAESLRSNVPDLRDAIEAGDDVAALSVLGKIERILSRPMDASAIRSEVLEHTKVVDKLVATEAKHLLQLNGHISVTEMGAVLTRFMLIVQRFVSKEDLPNLAVAAQDMMGAMGGEIMIDARRAELGLDKEQNDE